MTYLFRLIILCSLLISPALFAVIVNFPTLEDVQQRVDNISTDELKAALEKNPELLLIDVRTAKEIQTINGTIDALNNKNIPRGWLEFRIKDIAPDKSTPIVVYCGTNQRSPFAADTLTKMGYHNVKNYADGFFAWKKAGLPVKMIDKAPDSMLYSKPQKVAEGVYSAIGETGPPSYINSEHNNNLSFIISDKGVLVVNAGGSYLLAKALHEEIKKITDKPIKYVVLENGQGHAMLGSNYWKEQGVPIIAHKDAAEEIKKHGEEILERMQKRQKDKALGTELAMPDKTFEDKKFDIQLGKEKIQLLNLGPAHSPGDIMVWLPERSIIITGDMAFHQRLLPIFEDTDTKAWLETWEKFATLNAKTIIPGHGEPTTMEEVTKYTKDYLVYMRKEVKKIIDEGGDLQDAYKIDQSAYAHLPAYDLLYKRNAGQIFQEMEFEE